MVTTAPPGNRAPRSSAPRSPSIRVQRAEAAMFRRSLTLVGLSVVAPGTAQLIAGNRRLGRAVLWTWVGLVVLCGLVLWLVPLDELAGLFVRPWLLTAIKLLLFAAAIGWIALVVDAWRLGHPPGLNRKHRLVMVGTTLALSAMVATPLLLAARYASAAHEAVVALFPSSDAAVASDGRLNILLLGADAGKGRVGVRPDSISVVSIDVRTGAPLLVSVPRNLEKARFTEGSPAAALFPDGFSGAGDRGEWLINATWTYGEDNPKLFPGDGEPGVTAVKQAVEGTLGLPVHYFVVIDLDGFSDLVDALGGVTIRITEPIPIGSGGEVLEPGLRRLDGYEALWYARSRTGSSDYARMSRQRCVLGAILHEADPSTVLRNFTALAQASTSVITTDIPQAELPELVDLAWRAKDLPVTSLQLVPPLIEPADPDLGVIAEQLDLAMAVSVDAGSDDADNEATRAPTATADVQDAAAADGDGPSEADPAANDAAAEAPPPAVDLSSVCSYE
jgi:polyisoprenyl-teichoic acid--peptidoglycan teichoic acid transferase